MITLTNRAVEKVRSLLAAELQEFDGLRVAVKAGGCSGYQYDLFFDKEQDGDWKGTFDGVLVVVDIESASFLTGASLDYREGLQESGFKIDNPNSKRSCGCGQSFS